MVMFKMRESVPSPRYYAICNVLRQWKTLLIPTIESTNSMVPIIHACAHVPAKIGKYTMSCLHIKEPVKVAGQLICRLNHYALDDLMTA